MTRSAPHRRDPASSSTSLRGRLASCALALLLVTPATALLATAEDGSDSPPAAALELAPFNDKAFLAARGKGSPVGLYFEADWCAPCKEMHAKTFRDPAVVEAAAGIRFFRVDMTTSDAYVDLVKKSFRVSGAPTLILFGPDGKESGRRFGYIPPDDFAELLGRSRGPSERSRQSGAPARA
ncbi:MAG: thioredoxin fold domain-containing protein [Candidatus Binatia bacterium]